MPVPQPVPWFLSGHYPSWLPSQKAPVLLRDATWLATAGQPAARSYFPSVHLPLMTSTSRALVGGAHLGKQRAMFE